MILSSGAGPRAREHREGPQNAPGADRAFRNGPQGAGKSPCGREPLRRLPLVEPLGGGSSGGPTRPPPLRDTERRQVARAQAMGSGAREAGCLNLAFPVLLSRSSLGAPSAQELPTCLATTGSTLLTGMAAALRKADLQLKGKLSFLKIVCAQQGRA
jgi:hypothetical protein